MEVLQDQNLVMEKMAAQAAEAMDRIQEQMAVQQLNQTKVAIQEITDLEILVAAAPQVHKVVAAAVPVLLVKPLAQLVQMLVPVVQEEHTLLQTVQVQFIMQAAVAEVHIKHLVKVVLLVTAAAEEVLQLLLQEIQ